MFHKPRRIILQIEREEITMSNWFVEPMKDEVPYSEILKKAENGEFHEWNFQPLDFQENGYEDVIDEIKKYTAVEYLHLKELKEKAEKEGDKQAAQEYADKMEEMVQAVMKIYREKNIFPIQYFSEFGILDEIAKCIAYKAEFDGNTVSCVTGDTMYFNGIQWKPISEYTEGEWVLQFNEDGTASLVKPFEYVHYQSDDPFYDYNAFMLSSAQTGNHDVVYWTKENGYQKIKQSEVEADSNFSIPISCIVVGGRVLSEDKISLVASFITMGLTNNSNECSILLKAVYNQIEPYLEDIYMNKTNRDRLITECLYPIFKDYADKYKHQSICCELEVATLVRNILSFSGEHAYFYRYLNKSFKVVWSTFSRYYNGIDNTEMLGNNKVFSRYSSNKRGICFKQTYEKDKYCFVVPSHMLVLMRGGSLYVTGNCGAGVGTSLCNYLFPNLYDTPSAHDLDKENARSLFEKFHNDKYLRRAIEFCFGYKNGCPVPTSVTGGLRLVGSAPTNFRPMNAKAVYERFCPKGGVIYDYCCGFGGRLLGALSSKNNYKYVGTDPCTETMYHLHQLGQYIEQVTGREDSYELHCCGSEEFRGPKNSIDFAFSSPPYFNLEVYSDEPTQCFNKFPELEGWLEGFVRPTIQNIKHMLKPGKLYAVNIADFKVGSGKEVAYVDEWIRISTEEGMPLFDTVYLGVTARAGSAEQAAGELKKENILIFKKPLW